VIYPAPCMQVHASSRIQTYTDALSPVVRDCGTPRPWFALRYFEGKWRTTKGIYPETCHLLVRHCRVIYAPLFVGFPVTFE
jgi:hypothetical protein